MELCQRSSLGHHPLSTLHAHTHACAREGRGSPSEESLLRIQGLVLRLAPLSLGSTFSLTLPRRSLSQDSGSREGKGSVAKISL